MDIFKRSRDNAGNNYQQNTHSAKIFRIAKVPSTEIAMRNELLVPGHDFTPHIGFLIVDGQLLLIFL